MAFEDGDEVEELVEVKKGSSKALNENWKENWSGAVQRKKGSSF